MKTAHNNQFNPMQMPLDPAHVIGAMDYMGIVPRQWREFKSKISGMTTRIILEGGMVVIVGQGNNSAMITVRTERGSLKLFQATHTMPEFIEDLIVKMIEYKIPVQRKGVPIAGLMWEEGREYAKYRKANKARGSELN